MVYLFESFLEDVLCLLEKKSLFKFVLNHKLLSLQSTIIRGVELFLFFLDK
jgi:hypothetical protein